MKRQKERKNKNGLESDNCTGGIIFCCKMAGTHHIIKRGSTQNGVWNGRENDTSENFNGTVTSSGSCHDGSDADLVLIRKIIRM